MTRTQKAQANSFAEPSGMSDREPIADADPYSVARNIALRSLTMAPRSRAQLRETLAKKLVPDDVAESVLDRLTEVGLIDDQAYAHMLVRARQASKGLARRALAQELRTKGIADDLAIEALGHVTDEQERDMAQALVAKKLRSMNNLATDVKVRRLTGMLARKGYSPSVIYGVIKAELAAETDVA